MYNCLSKSKNNMEPTIPSASQGFNRPCSLFYNIEARITAASKQLIIYEQNTTISCTLHPADLGLNY